MLVFGNAIPKPAAGLTHQCNAQTHSRAFGPRPKEGPEAFAEKLNNPVFSRGNTVFTSAQLSGN